MMMISMLGQCPGCQFPLSSITRSLNQQLAKNPDLDKEKFIESKMPDTGGLICCRVNILTAVRVTDSQFERHKNK